MDRPGIPTLTTPRLVLRPFVPGDLDELAVIHAEESFWWYPLRSGMSKEETAGFLERVAGALRERRLRDRGAARPGQRGHDRVGGPRRAALPARDPPGRRGGVAPRRIAGVGAAWPPRPVPPRWSSASRRAASSASSASTSRRTWPRAASWSTSASPTGSRPRATRRGDRRHGADAGALGGGRRWVTSSSRRRSSPSATAASPPWCTPTGRSGAPAAGTWRPWRCGRRERRATWPGRPASSATTSRWPPSRRSTWW